VKLLKRVSRLEVKRCFVISDKAKPEQLLTKNQFLTNLDRVKKEVIAFSEGELDQFIAKDPVRLRAYDKLKWYLATVSPKEIGIWREAGGLPVEWTKGSLHDTSQKVFKAIMENDIRTSNHQRVGFAIHGILQEQDVIENEKYLYPIILPGDMAGRAGLERLSGEIDDGNMRSIAFAADGDVVLKVYVGLRNRELVINKIKKVFECSCSFPQ
jgi:hypothetical protein